MKQIIVMIAMIMLGIVIAGFVGDFGDSAKSISESANKQVTRVTSSGGI